MFIAEKLIELVAPHYCMVCGDEGAIVCGWCLPNFALPLPERCYVCKAATLDSRVCTKCRRKSSLRHVWVRTEYDGQPKQLIHDFKFERKQAAAGPIAQLMTEALPYMEKGTVVVHVPTATSRVRRRGYDHAELLAKALARELGLEHKTLLRRIAQTRQVGAKRVERLQQMEQAFRATHLDRFEKTAILLVDDLTTTGATIESAAKCLRKSGAKTVDAAVFAQKQ